MITYNILAHIMNSILHSNGGFHPISTIFYGRKDIEHPLTHNLNSKYPWYGCTALCLHVRTFVCSWKCFSGEIIWHFIRIFHNPENFLQSWIAKIATFPISVIEWSSNVKFKRGCILSNELIVEKSKMSK